MKATKFVIIKAIQKIIINEKINSWDIHDAHPRRLISTFVIRCLDSVYI